MSFVSVALITMTDCPVFRLAGGMDNFIMFIVQSNSAESKFKFKFHKYLRTFQIGVGFLMWSRPFHFNLSKNVSEM